MAPNPNHAQPKHVRQVSKWRRLLGKLERSDCTALALKKAEADHSPGHTNGCWSVRLFNKVRIGAWAQTLAMGHGAAGV